MFEPLIAKWATFTSSQKRNSVIVVFIVVFVLVFALASGDRAEIVIPTRNVSEQGAFDAGDEEVTFANLATQLSSLSQQVDVLNQRDNSTQTTVLRLEELLSNLSNDDEALRTFYETNKRLRELENELNQVKRQKATMPSQPMPTVTVTAPLDEAKNDLDFSDEQTTDDGVSLTELPDASDTPKQNTFIPARRPFNDDVTISAIPSDPLDFVESSINGTLNTSSTIATSDDGNVFIDSQQPTVDNYAGQTTILTMTDEVAKEVEKTTRTQTVIKGKRVLAGSSIRGILLSGVDAPTGVAASEGAVPASLRVSDFALLPNGKRVDLRGCIITAAVRGDSATERANFRTNRMTCSFSYGDVDIGIQGYVSGKDGVSGIRGKLINKQGKALLYGAVTGLTGGVATAFSGGNNNNRSILSTGSDPYALPESSTVLGASATGAVTNTSEFLTEYYSKRLDELYEIIEVKPLIEVTVHVMTTFELELMD